MSEYEMSRSYEKEDREQRRFVDDEREEPREEEREREEVAFHVPRD
jgi:hypothetical protein